MTDGKLIEQTLSLNDGVPLFDFNVNFTALKKLLVDFNVVQEEHRDQLNELRMLVRSKADKESVRDGLRRSTSTSPCSTAPST